jgi:chromosomal replication initiation ATPase DnaA
MARGSQHAKEWHFSQDSVFFHSIDELDTSRSTIVLTSNRPDLIDNAIQDRFMSYVIDYPDLETLLAMLEQLPAFAQLDARQRSALKDELVAAAKEGSVRSMRDAQRFAMRYFISKLLKKGSLAQQFAG